MSDRPSRRNESDSYNKDYKKRGGEGAMDPRRRMYLKRKICRFCSDKSLIIDYKKPEVLRRFTTLGGKIIPRRMSGNCAKHQRMLAGEIKRARYICLLPYVKQ